MARLVKKETIQDEVDELGSSSFVKQEEQEEPKPEVNDARETFFRVRPPPPLLFSFYTSSSRLPFRRSRELSNDIEQPSGRRQLRQRSHLVVLLALPP